MRSCLITVVGLSLTLALSTQTVDAGALRGSEPPTEEPTDEDPDDGKFERTLELKPDQDDGDDGGTDSGDGESTNTGSSGNTTAGNSSGTNNGATSGATATTLPPRIPCTWRNSPATEEQVDLYNRVYVILDELVDAFSDTNSVAFEVTFYVDDGILHQWSVLNARFERYQTANCAGATRLTVTEARGWRWVAVTPPTADILIPDLTLVVTGRIQPPISAINPPYEAAINLGLWFAVANPDDIVATGRLGPLWATGTATLTSTTFDPGNGTTPISCPGGGEPIPDAQRDDVAQGPCGYTYRSYDDVLNDDLVITATTNWTITWDTSDGTGENEPPETRTRTNTYPYDVNEIQTVGS